MYEFELYFATCFGSSQKCHRQAVRYKVKVMYVAHSIGTDNTRTTKVQHK